MGNGYTDFLPAPAESRRIITANYRVPQTLLLQFSDDAIDETAVIAPGLQQQGRGEHPKKELSAGYKYFKKI